LTFTFVDPDEEESQEGEDAGKILENIPIVRVIIKPSGK